ncbi:unnamed protein product [Clonostachys byssicola]|uniref:Zn(2)-C6 fungal-type domain-containing protein n=1 Tax=Clonostachys byssicola TaxID=160290 RepID=A0A9N9Y9P0_9HYPO|nr:unnamed protein product [Clonostachys byssicola]
MPRSRNGCATCKKRHRKCDEAKPTCYECEENGLQCEGYQVKLQWDVGVASRGLLRGATVPVTPSASSPGRHEVTDLIHGSMFPDSNAWINRAPLPLGGGSLGQPVATHVASANAVADDEMRQLFKQFNETTVTLLYSTSTQDPFRAYVEKLALQSEALYNIVVAIHIYCACHGSPPPLFHELFNRGLHLYQQQLQLSQHTLDPGMLITGMFICTLHLFEGTPWTSHLSHLDRVHKLRDAGQTICKNPQLRAPVEAMATIDIPTFVRGREIPSLGLWARIREEQSATAEGMADDVETVSGLPRSLIDIFARIDNQSAEDAFVTWPGHVGDVPHCHLWEAYRLAGILIGRRFRGEARDQAGRGGSALFSVSEVLVHRLIAVLDALHECQSRPEYSHVLAGNGILYPCTAARLEVAVLQRKPAWVEALGRYESSCLPYHRTPNAIHLREILDLALQQGDDNVDLDEEARKRGLEISLF